VFTCTHTFSHDVVNLSFYLVGDVTVPFTLQSCSKPLTYAMALETLGPDVVHKYVGTEPSGRNFNELILDYNSAYQYSNT
jgi:glutaminase